MGGGAYGNSTFYDGVIELLGMYYEYEHSRVLMQSAERSALWFSGDGFKSISNVEVEVMCVGWFDYERHKSKVDYFYASEVNYAAVKTVNPLTPQQFLAHKNLPSKAVSESERAGASCQTPLLASPSMALELCLVQRTLLLQGGWLPLRA